jgi:DNA-directed RNA polymerase specialized sigma24 family protein
VTYRVMRTEEVAPLEPIELTQPEDSYLGGHEGFDDWYRRERPKVLAAIAFRCGSVDLAAEATDEAFLRAFDKWLRVSAMSSPTAWTVAVALNVNRRRMRRRSIEHTLLRRATAPPDLPGPAGEVFELVSQLPSPQREIVLLRYVADLPQADIAVALKVSRSTVSTSLTSARRELRQLLGDESIGDTTS